MAREFDFHYTPLEGKLPGLKFQKQTEDAINDIGQRVVDIQDDAETAIETAETAMETAQEAKDIADGLETAIENAQQSADNANASIVTINNTLTEISWTQDFVDVDGVLYQKVSGEEEEEGEDTEELKQVANRYGQSLIANAINSLNTRLLAERLVSCTNVAQMVDTDIPVGAYVETKGYYAVNDGGNARYSIRASVAGETYDNGSLILLDNGNVAELITDGVMVNVCQFGCTSGEYINDYWDNLVAYCQAKNLTLYFPPGTYKIKKTTGQSYGISTKFFSMRGERAETIFECDSTFDNATDAFYFSANNPNQNWRGFIHGIEFKSVDETKVRYFLHFAGGNTVSTYQELDIRWNYFYNHASYAIYSPGNSSSGLFIDSNFSDNMCRGAFLKVDLFGDSNKIERNLLFGYGSTVETTPKYIINIIQTQGSAGCRVVGNNCSSGLGYFENMESCLFDSNQIENVAQTNLDYALKMHNCNSCTLINNTISGHGKSGLLYIKGAANTVDNIYLANEKVGAYALDVSTSFLLINRVRYTNNLDENNLLLNLPYIPGDKVNGTGGATQVFYKDEYKEMISTTNGVLFFKPLSTSNTDFEPFRLISSDYDYDYKLNQYSGGNPINVHVNNRHNIRVSALPIGFIKLDACLWTYE